jgi:hypothetical protein
VEVHSDSAVVDSQEEVLNSVLVALEEEVVEVAEEILLAFSFNN